MTAKMRSISEAYRQLRTDDPNTALTLCALRRLVATGEIPSLRVGRKILINYDSLLAYLNKPVILASKARPASSHIRPIY